MFKEVAVGSGLLEWLGGVVLCVSTVSHGVGKLFVFRAYPFSGRQKLELQCQKILLLQDLMQDQDPCSDRWDAVKGAVSAKPSRQCTSSNTNASKAISERRGTSR